MKRLKFLCPFGGKKYPSVALALGLIIPMILSTKGVISVDTAFWLMIFLTVFFLGICFYLANRLTKEEQSIVERTAAPLWEPVTPELVELMQGTTERFNNTEVTLISIAIIMGIMGIMPDPRSGGTRTYILAIGFLFAAATVALHFLRRVIWRSLDETAVYTVIPVHDIYDVTHRTRHGSYTISYLVFYQPDGRYVLKAKPGTADAGAIAVVKFHGLMTWIPYTKNPSRESVLPY